MNWQKFAFDTLHQMTSWGGALMTTFGLGGGVGLVKLLNHWPAPYDDSPYGGAFFDTLQDLVSNKRIGERRTRAGVIVAPIAKMDPIPDPKAAPVLSPQPGNPGNETPA